MASKSKKDQTFLQKQRIGHLATVDAQGRPVVVPFCFAFDGKAFYSSIDEKPKTVSPERLRRARNIRANPEVALVIDHYDEDWGRLQFVLIRGRARILHSGKEHARAVALLRKKYHQYRRMRIEDRPMLKIVPWKIFRWKAEE